jgi:hypothetical protein
MPDEQVSHSSVTRCWLNLDSQALHRSISQKQDISGGAAAVLIHGTAQFGSRSMSKFTINRRTAFTGAAALTLVPAVAGAATAKTTTIGKLWAEAEALQAKLAFYRAEIQASAENGGIAGWMRLGGEANTLGGERYQRLMAILNSTPANADDLKIMAKVVLDEEIQNGAKGFAADRFAQATLTLAA